MNSKDNLVGKLCTNAVFVSNATKQLLISLQDHHLVYFDLQRTKLPSKNTPCEL